MNNAKNYFFSETLYELSKLDMAVAKVAYPWGLFTLVNTERLLIYAIVVC